MNDYMILPETEDGLDPIDGDVEVWAKSDGSVLIETHSELGGPTLLSKDDAIALMEWLSRVTS